MPPSALGGDRSICVCSPFLYLPNVLWEIIILVTFRNQVFCEDEYVCVERQDGSATLICETPGFLVVFREITTGTFQSLPCVLIVFLCNSKHRVVAVCGWQGMLLLLNVPFLFAERADPNLDSTGFQFASNLSSGLHDCSGVQNQESLRSRSLEHGNEISETLQDNRVATMGNRGISVGVDVR